MKKTTLLLPLAFLLFGCDAQTSATKTIDASTVEQCSQGEYAYSLPVDLEKYTHAMALFSQEGGITLMQRQNLSKLVSHCHKLKTS